MDLEKLLDGLREPYLCVTWEWGKEGAIPIPQLFVELVGYQAYQVSASASPLAIHFIYSNWGAQHQH